MEILIFVLFAVTIIWLCSSSFVDIKKREAPDWLNYSLIFFGLGSRIIYSLFFNNYLNLLRDLIFFGFAVVFSLGMYYCRMWGGGDTKLLMGLGVVIGSFNFVFFGFNFPFFLLVLINIFLIGGIYGLIYSIVLCIKNWNKFLLEWKKTSKKILYIVFGIGLFLSGLSLLVFYGNYRIFGLELSLLLVVLFYLLYFVHCVDKVCMYKNIFTSKLVPGDWLAENVILRGKLICKRTNIGINKKDILNLKKNKIKKVLVKDGIPFVPSFLLGFLFSLIFLF